MEKIDKMMSRGSKAIAYVSAGVILVMMLLVVCDVFLRYLFSAPIKGSYEMVSLLMTIAVFFSFAYAQKTKSLVYMTFFQQTIVIRTMATTTASLYIPLYPFYFIMGIAFAGFTVMVLYDAVKAVVAVFHKKVAEIVMAEWPL